jgi:hypothetical protein
MKKQRFPPGWHEKRIRQVLAHYENQREEQAVNKDKGSLKGNRRTLVEVPSELMPLIRRIVAQYKTTAKG